MNKTSISILCVAMLLCMLATVAVANDFLTATEPTFKSQRISPHQRFNALLQSSMGKSLRSDATCTKFPCTGLGSSCDGDMITNRDTCKNCCAFGLTCHQQKCVDNLLGEQCVADQDCLLPNEVSIPYKEIQCRSPTPNAQKVCTLVKYPNDSCQLDSDCTGTTTCQDGKCLGIANGGTCIVNEYECAYGLYCHPNNQDKSTGVCMARLADNVPCDPSIPMQCATWECVDHVCVDFFSQSEGEKCVPDVEGVPTMDIEYTACEVGLYCDTGDEVNSKNGTCEKPPKNTFQKCSTDNDCTGIGSESCECMGFSGSKYCMETPYTPSECGDAYNSFWSCIEKNQCFPDTLFQDGTCIQDKCRKQAAQMISCQCDLIEIFFGKCFYSPLAKCGGGSSSNTAGIVIGVIFAVLVLVLGVGGGIYYYRSRQRQEYDIVG